jgi:hypothetical protein
VASHRRSNGACHEQQDSRQKVRAPTAPAPHGILRNPQRQPHMALAKPGCIAVYGRDRLDNAQPCCRGDQTSVAPVCGAHGRLACRPALAVERHRCMHNALFASVVLSIDAPQAQISTFTRCLRKRRDRGPMQRQTTTIPVRVMDPRDSTDIT